VWPFRQKAEAPAADGPRPVPAPVIRREWVGLPPIQRFVGAHPLTAPSDRFRDDLATHQDPSVSSDTMGHQVSAEAPPGLVLALARPTTRSDGPAMIPRPRVQRSTAGAVAESGEWDGDEAAPELARPTPLPASAHPVAARELPVVAAEPAVQRLISLAPDAEPTPVAPRAQRSIASNALTMPGPSAEPFEMSTASIQRLTLGQSRRMGLGAPIKQVPDHSVQRAELPLASLPQKGREPMETSPGIAIDAPLATPVATGAPLMQRTPMDLAPKGTAPNISSGPKETMPSALIIPPAPSIEAADELRLDLPLARRPSAQDVSAAEPEPIPPTAPSVQLSATSSVAPSAESSSPAPTAVHRLAEGDWPTLFSTERPQALTMPYAPAATVLHASTSRLPFASDSPARASTSTSAPGPQMAMAPLVGTRPLRPSATVQRDTSINAPTLSLPQRGREDSQGGTESPFTEGRQLPLMRASDDTPDEDAPPHVGRELESTRGRQEQPLTLAPSRGFAVQRTSQAVDDSESESLEVPTESNAPALQGAWYDSISAGARSMTSGASSSGASTAGSAIGGVASSLTGHKPEETDMDELAGKLYDRIRSRLKTELLVDRERAGFLTDLR
jgi:hypothetical protein